MNRESFISNCVHPDRKSRIFRDQEGRPFQVEVVCVKCGGFWYLECEEIEEEL